MAATSGSLPVMTRKLDEQHDETQHSPDAASDAAGGLTVTLWLLAILVAQVEVILLDRRAHVLALGSAKPKRGSGMAAAPGTLSSFTT